MQKTQQSSQYTHNKCSSQAIHNVLDSYAKLQSSQDGNKPLDTVREEQQIGKQTENNSIDRSSATQLYHPQKYCSNQHIFKKNSIKLGRNTSEKHNQDCKDACQDIKQTPFQQVAISQIINQEHLLEKCNDIMLEEDETKVQLNSSNQMLSSSISYAETQKYSQNLLNQNKLSFNTQQCSSKKLGQVSSHISNPNNLKGKIPNSITFRSNVRKITHYSNELILVYLMYKQQKLSLFLNKGVSYQELTKRMFKEIYIYEKQTYSLSNAILKNILHKITGFQSIDGDKVYDYELKYKRGTLQSQKFFVPFKQQSSQMPFKIYQKIKQNRYGGHQFLVRNYSDGQFAILKSIKKEKLGDEKVNAIKKALKYNFNSCGLLTRSSSSSFSQFNWFQTKYHIFMLSEFYPQNLQQNLRNNEIIYQEADIEEILKFFIKWFAYIFKSMVQLNIQNYKKLQLSSILLSCHDGYPKVNVLQNAFTFMQFLQKRKSLTQNGKRISQKISDKFYQQTYIKLLKNIHSIFQQKMVSNESNQLLYKQVLQTSQNQNFSFDSILKHEQLCEMNMTNGVLLKRQKNPLKIDYNQNIKNILSSTAHVKSSVNLKSNQQANKEAILISQTKEQIQRAFNMQIIRKNQQRNENKTILQLITHLNGTQVHKQNIGNITQYKKEEERKFQLKTKQKSYIQQIMNEINKNDNFIKTTKENNLASIKFYLQRSDTNVKNTIVHKIESKYKKYFQRKTTEPSYEYDSVDKSELMESFMKNSFKLSNQCQQTPQRYQTHGHNETDKQESGGSNFLQPLYGNKNLYNLGKTNELKLDSNVKLRGNNLQSNQKLNQSKLGVVRSASNMVIRNQTNKLERKTFRRKYRYSTQKVATSLKKRRLQQLFVNRKDYSKQDKLMLKKRQYGIYMIEAQKQYSKIKIYQNGPSNRIT